MIRKIMIVTPFVLAVGGLVVLVIRGPVEMRIAIATLAGGSWLLWALLSILEGDWND